MKCLVNKDDLRLGILWFLGCQASSHLNLGRADFDEMSGNKPYMTRLTNLSVEFRKQGIFPIEQYFPRHKKLKNKAQLTSWLRQR
jgi:hypothetical protein